ncbi:MAG: hypothetical protein ACLTWE_10365 [Dysgonomonas mossii]|uniref:hypothetical protein n=1 Tax=Dysgonomonas mossii TaxID=163665 RepID=UPI003992517F
MSRIKKKEIKYHKIQLELIKEFKTSKLGKLISKKESFNGKNAKFSPHKKEFTINFQNDIFSKSRKNLSVGEYHKGIQIQFGKTIYNLENVFLGKYTSSEITGSIDRIHTDGFSEKHKCYYQLIIPLEKKLDFHYNIMETPFISDLGYYSRKGTTAIINGESISVCCIHDDKNKYFLAIDSSAKQTFDEFAEKTHAITIGIGYMSGYYAGNQGFYFTYTRRDKKEPKLFRCIALRDSIKSSYSPVYSNAYGYLYHNRPLAKKYISLLRPISLNEFSLLCEKIYNSLDFSSTLMLMLESSVASLLFMPGGYAIALETLSDLVIGKTKSTLAPIKTKSVSRLIRKSFLEILDINSATISSSDLEILKKRINQFNQTTNKARLREPFNLLSIDLLDEDLKILETRNDFLHGRVPDLTNAGSARSTDRINKDLYYCSMRFYTLLNMIILKWVGYDNRVVNYTQINEKFTQIHLKEEPFRQV